MLEGGEFELNDRGDDMKSDRDVLAAIRSFVALKLAEYADTNGSASVEPSKQDSSGNYVQTDEQYTETNVTIHRDAVNELYEMYQRGDKTDQFFLDAADDFKNDLAVLKGARKSARGR